MQINDKVTYKGKDYVVYNEVGEDKKTWLLAPTPDSNETDFIEVGKVELESYLFEEAARPLMKYMCDHHHPHVSVIVTPVSAELLEGMRSTGKIMDYVRD
jgi:hypothetical protein